MKAKDYFEEKKSNMRELWNLSDTQKEMMYSLMEQYVAFHIADVRRNYSLDEVREIVLEYRNACMYEHSHKLTRFELQAELRKIDEKHGLDYKEGLDYNFA